MKFTIPGPLPDNIYNISRKLGYHFERVVKNADGANEAAFSRVMGASGYPKFHLFLIENNGILEFRLHLDQKSQHTAAVMLMPVNTAAQQLKMKQKNTANSKF